MNTWAAPGVQCVCINDDFGCAQVGSCSIPTRVPMINEILTVKTVEARDEMICLTFEEIDEYQMDIQPDGFLGGWVLFDSVCFRPLEKRKTDIEIFRKMLTPAGRIPVDA